MSWPTIVLLNRSCTVYVTVVFARARLRLRMLGLALVSEPRSIQTLRKGSKQALERVSEVQAG